MELIMKSFSLLAILANLVAAEAMSQGKIPTIQHAEYLGDSQLSVTYSYSGGCAEHDFQLELQGRCTRSFPQQCFAEIVEVNPVEDFCKALISETRVFELSDPNILAQPTILKILSGEHDVYTVALNTEQIVEKPATVEQDAVIERVRLSPLSNAVTPPAFAYKVKAAVQLGSNPCMAQGVKVKFNKEVVDNTLVVTALRELPQDYGMRICTREYRPVFQELDTELHGFADVISTIVLRHVGELRADYQLPIE